MIRRFTGLSSFAANNTAPTSTVARAVAASTSFLFRTCSSSSSNNSNNTNKKEEGEATTNTHKKELSADEQLAQALKNQFEIKHKGGTLKTDSSSTATTESSSSSSSSEEQSSSDNNNSSSTGNGNNTQKRRIRMRERNTVEEKTTAFRTGAGSFLAGFSSMSLISLGCAFLFVPLYRLYCSPQGRGADPKFIAKKVQAEKKGDEDDPNPVRRKLLSVRFLSDVGNTLPIAFVPLQRKMDVLIGEPALAFYSSYNKSNKTLLGVSTYTISPVEAMAYLNKIQCFCFEEQRFKPHELVEMPVFFYIDKDFLNDPMVSWLDEVILNYTFFNMEKTRDLVGKFQSVKSAQY